MGALPALLLLGGEETLWLRGVGGAAGHLWLLKLGEDDSPCAVRGYISSLSGRCHPHVASSSREPTSTGYSEVSP